MGEFDRGFTLYVGNMFGGKTLNMIQDLNIAREILKRKIQVFKPCIDDRYSRDYISANEEKLKFPATEIENAGDLEKLFLSTTEIVAIDEIQFLDKRVRDFIRDYKDKVKIIGTGLLRDYRGELFKLREIGDNKKDSELDMGNIIGLIDPLNPSDKISYRFPRCTESKNGDICGRLAQYIQRLEKEDGSFSPYEANTIITGGTNLYLPRCEKHFVKPERKV